MPVEMRAFQQFFDGLQPRLDTARTLQRELDSQLAQRFNVFDYLRTDELGLSRIVADLLDPKGRHGQGPMFLELLLWKLKRPFATTRGHLDHASVDVEKTIEGDRRLDIYVSIGDYCLAIENKPYAGDQPRQVDDYLRWLNQRFKSSLLIYLSPRGEPPSRESVALADRQGKLDARHFFNIMPYDRAQGDAWDDDFGDYRLDFTLSDWLADCQKSCKVDRLRWFLRDAEFFCRRTVGGHTVASAESNTLKDFVLADKEKWATALVVSSTLPQIVEEVCNHFMKMVSDALLKEMKWANTRIHRLLGCIQRGGRAISG